MNDIKVVTIADNEEYLRQVSLPVDASDKNLKNDISILDKYCSENSVLAMAAVQLGIPKRIIYLKNTNLDIVNKSQSDSLSEEEKNYNESKVLINPVIISREGLTEYWEACASCLDNFGLVKRPYKITLEYFDVDFKKHSKVFEGFEATVLSHEYDHLDGVLHMDIADKLLIMKQEDRKKFRLEHNYNIISKAGKYEDLLKNKSYQKK